MNTRPSFFQKIVESTKDNKTLVLRTKQSLLWYRRKIEEIFPKQTALPVSVFDKNDYPNLPFPGNIVTFKYDPKGKNSLPYYDVFPMVLVLKLVPGGFLGLNFHYLYPADRALFMDRLYKHQKITTRAGKTPSIKINITYEVLKQKKSLFYYRAALKRYKNAHLRGMFHTFVPNEWDMALFLPTEKFIHEKKQTVWRNSRKING